MARTNRSLRSGAPRPGEPRRSGGGGGETPAAEAEAAPLGRMRERLHLACYAARAVSSALGEQEPLPVLALHTSRAERFSPSAALAGMTARAARARTGARHPSLGAERRSIRAALAAARIAWPLFPFAWHNVKAKHETEHGQGEGGRGGAERDDGRTQMAAGAASSTAGRAARSAHTDDGSGGHHERNISAEAAVLTDIFSLPELRRSV